jgi:hypothetical protein
MVVQAHIYVAPDAGSSTSLVPSPTSSSSPSSTPVPQPAPTLGKVAIAGICIGILGCLGIAVLLLFLSRRRPKKYTEPGHNLNEPVCAENDLMCSKCGTGIIGDDSVK